jgi:hypothetical protein
MLEVVRGDSGGCVGERERVKVENGAPACGISGVTVRQCAPPRGSCIAARLLGIFLCKYFAFFLCAFLSCPVILCFRERILCELD